MKSLQSNQDSQPEKPVGRANTATVASLELAVSPASPVSMFSWENSSRRLSRDSASGMLRAGQFFRKQGYVHVRRQEGGCVGQWRA
jgi:hypothetical protein